MTRPLALGRHLVWHANILIALVAVAGPWTSAAAQAPAPSNLVLSCQGRATFRIPNLDWDKEKQQYGDDKRVDTAGRVGLKIQDGAVKVRLPSGVPGGGSWRDANHVEISAEAISGRVLSARFSVDRRTGDIEMSGGLAFSGNCEKAPDETAPTKL